MLLLGAVIVAQTGWLARRLYPHKPELPKLAAWAMAGASRQMASAHVFKIVTLAAIRHLVIRPPCGPPMGADFAASGGKGKGLSAVPPRWPGAELTRSRGIL